jgi:hypothetical protein
MNNTNCNRNLPANALSTTKIVEGMRISFAFDTDGVHKVLGVARFGQNILIRTDKGTKRANAAGTVRLEGVEGYDYHEGHGCQS